MSPDGRWLAYQFVDAGTGVRRIRLENLETGVATELAPPDVTTIKPTWSPDSRLLAYSSSATGKQMLWVWDRTTGKTRVIDNVEFPDQARSGARWFPDSRRLVVALWPEGRPHPSKQTNRESSREPLGPFRPPFTSAAPDQLSVYVHRANLEPAKRRESASAPLDPEYARSKYIGCDLGVVDLRDGSVVRIASDLQLRTSQLPSPDGRLVAYTVWRARSPRTQLEIYDLHVFDLQARVGRVVAANLTPYVGMFNWSPDSRSIAFLALRTDHQGVGNREKASPADLAVISIAGGAAKTLHHQGLPVFYGRTDLLWSSDSRSLFARSIDDQFWAVDVATAAGRAVFARRGQQIKAVIRPNEQDVMWTAPTSRRAMLAVETPSEFRFAIVGVELSSGAVTTLYEKTESLSQQYIDASAKGTIAFVTSHQKSPSDLWLWRQDGAGPAKVGGLNRFLDSVALGDARRLTWRTEDGRELAGALLLPPGWKAGQRPPLFVWVYGGRQGSEQLNKFGFSGGGSSTAVNNMQILASRGYAVLNPDAPQRMGTPMRDVVSAVMPGVDAAIALGYADADRLAVGGHSYGSYSVLSLITHTTRFKAAVLSAVFDPNLVSEYLQMKASGNASYYWSEQGQGLMGGTPWEFPDRYRDNSPIFLFDRIATPVLMGQGEVDTGTEITGANAVFVALRRLGVPVEYRIYEGESHVLHRPAHVRDFWERRLAFLADNLDIAYDGDGRVILENGRVKSRGADAQRPSRSRGTDSVPCCVDPAAEPDLEVEMELQ